METARKGEIPPNTLENRRQRHSSVILPGKAVLNDLNKQSGADKEAKNLDHDRRSTTQAKANPKGFYGEEAEVQNMSPH